MKYICGASADALSSDCLTSRSPFFRLKSIEALKKHVSGPFAIPIAKAKGGYLKLRPSRDTTPREEKKLVDLNLKKLNLLKTFQV